MNRRETVERAAEQWARDLTDESGRNRLLYYKDLKVGTLDLTEAEPRAVDRLRNGRKVQLSQLFPAPVDDDYLALEFEGQAGNDGQDILAEGVKRARSISRKAQEYYEEKGIQTLFLGWGMATWTAQSTRATPAAPVLLCPIGLHRKGTAETDYDFELTGEWTLNEALLQHLANEFQVDVSGEDLMDPYGDGEQIGPDEEQAIFAELSRRAGSVPDFAIAERLIAGNFMYKKMPMVNDIKKNLDALTNHDLVAALAGDEAAVESVRLHSDHTIDPSWPDTLPPADEFLVLNADSSQNAAINAALSGHSFVLQGPPGTGKSQTISNLIATMMAQGKRVLFVAEKRAAIDAVVKRLTDVRLDRFVMDLHGGVSSRRKLAQQLDQSLIDIAETLAVNQQELHQHLQKSRQELSGYAEALHLEREPWGLSYFEVLSDLLRLETSEFSAGVNLQPSMWFTSSALAELDEATTQQVRRDLKDWVDLSEPLRSDRSPWTGAVVSSEEEARSALDVCSGLAGELTSSWQVQRNLLVGKLGIEDPGSITNWGDLMAEVPELALAVAKTEAALTPGVFSADLPTLIQHLAPATGSGLEMLSDYLEIDKPRSAVEWGNVIAEVPDLARGVAKAEKSLTLEVFNQDLDKLVQDMAPATGSKLGNWAENLEFDGRRRFDGGVAVGWLGKFLDDLENVKPRSAVEWGNLIDEVPGMARAAAKAEESLTLEVFNQDLDKLVQDMAPATGSELGGLAEALGFVKPRSAVEWGNVIAEVPDLARGVAKAEKSLTLEVFNQDLDKLVQDMAPATGNARSRLFNKLFNRRFRSALSELENLKPGSSSRNARDLLEEVEAARTVAHRWTELGCSGSPQVLTDAVDASDEIADFIRRYQSALSELENLKPGSSSRNARDLLEEVEAARTVAHRWTELGCSGSPQVLTTMSTDVRNEIAELARRYQSALSELEGLRPGLSDINARDLFDEVESAWTLIHRWTELGCSGSPQVLGVLSIDAADEIADIAQRFQSALSELEGLMPGLSTRSARDLLEEVEAAHALSLQWTELGCSGSPKVLTNAVEASEAFNRMKDAVEQLTILLSGSRLADETTEEISSLVLELLNDQHTLFQLPKLHDVEHRLRTAHVGPLLDQVTTGVLSDDALETAFDHSRLRSIQREVLLEDGRLSGFQGTRQSRYVREFQQGDTQHIQDNPARVARRIAEHAVTALNQNPGQDQLIRKEARKKTRHLPLRRLFEQAPEALAAIRPCWAMSPLDVAQTLPPRPLFDLVVFDEASQVLPCDAIPALLRGQRAMVAGDSRQLPPTTFFDSSGGDDDLDEDDDSIAAYESILDRMDCPTIPSSAHLALPLSR